jgi:hypothetical protein
MFNSRLEYNLTNDEKLDYVYQELKKEENDRKWSRIWKWFWRIFIIANIFWLYLHPEAITNQFKDISSLVNPNLQGLPTDIS